MAKSKYTGFNAKKLAADAQKKSERSDETNYSDNWKPTIEKDQDRAEYIIRFLPNPDSTCPLGTPYVQRNAHMINFGEQYVYEPCPEKAKKVGKGDCPICAIVNPLFKCGDKKKEAVAYDRYAKARFFFNVYIVSDPRDDHANEGKIRIFECGKKIKTKCEQIQQDDLDDDRQGVAYFDLLEGADFKLIVTRVKGKNGEDMPNYDESIFIRLGKPLKLSNGEILDEDQLDVFMEKAFNLNNKLMSDSCFRSSDALSEIYESRGYPESMKKKKNSEEKEEAPAPPSTRASAESEDEDEDAPPRAPSRARAPDEDDEEDTPPSKSSRPVDKDEDEDEDEDVPSVPEEEEEEDRAESRNPDPSEQIEAEKEIEEDEDDLRALLGE